MPVAMVPPNDFFGKNYGLQSHLATISCVYALSPSVSWRVSSTRALVTLRRFNLEDDPLNLSISMSFCIILHGGLAPHINTTWTTRSWWRFCQVTEDYAHTMISFKLLSSVPACSILKISIIYMISIDKYGVCVCGYCMCFVHSHPHPCNHHRPPTNSPDRVHEATGSSDPSLGVLPVEAANEKSRSLRVSKRSHISKVSNIQLSTNCNHQGKKDRPQKKRGTAFLVFFFTNCWRCFHLAHLNLAQSLCHLFLTQLVKALCATFCWNDHDPEPPA